MTRIKEHVVLIEDERGRLIVARAGVKLGGFSLHQALAAGTPPGTSAFRALRAENVGAEPFGDRLAPRLVDVVLRLGFTASRRSANVAPMPQRFAPTKPVCTTWPGDCGRDVTGRDGSGVTVHALIAVEAHCS
jgi:hypothetical protein